MFVYLGGSVVGDAACDLQAPPAENTFAAGSREGPATPADAPGQHRQQRAGLEKTSSAERRGGTAERSCRPCGVQIRHSCPRRLASRPPPQPIGQTGLPRHVLAGQSCPQAGNGQSQLTTPEQEQAQQMPARERNGPTVQLRFQPCVTLALPSSLNQQVRDRWRLQGAQSDSALLPHELREISK